MGKRLSAVGILVGVLICCLGAQGKDLKAYYDEQKSAYLAEFKAPVIGNQVAITTKAGQQRVGTLFGLSERDVTVLTDRGEMKYKREQLDTSTRATFFAEDYAHAKAYEKTRKYKQGLLAAEAAPDHVAYISVKGDCDRSTEKETTYDKNGNNGQTKKKQTEVYGLDITVVNNAGKEDELMVEWYIIGHTVQDKEEGASTVLEEGRRSVKLKPKSRSSISITSEAVEMSEGRSTKRLKGGGGYETLIERTGKEMDGYVVLLKAGRELVDKKSSNRKYLSEEWMSRF